MQVASSGREVPKATSVRIEHRAADGNTTVLKAEISVLASEIIDSTVMSKKSLVAFLEAQIEDARKSGLLFSLHLKATMMKVSDPIIFGHAVGAYFKDLCHKHSTTFEEIGVDFNNGFGDLLPRLETLAVGLDARKQSSNCIAIPNATLR